MALLKYYINQLWLNLLMTCFVKGDVRDHCIYISSSIIYDVNISDFTPINEGMLYQCYQAPYNEAVELSVYSVVLHNGSALQIYSDGAGTIIDTNCGICPDEKQCPLCPAIISGNHIEFYMRKCAACLEPLLNISLTIVTEMNEPSCENGFFAIVPEGSMTCTIKEDFLLPEVRCLVPTCSESIISVNVNSEKIYHKFLPTSKPEICLWQLSVKARKHLKIFSTPNIKPHLIIYEDTLSNPLLDMEWCPMYFNEFHITASGDTVFIVYHNLLPLKEEGSMSATLQADLCLLPPHIENGLAEFRHNKNETLAVYACNSGHVLTGSDIVRCVDNEWEEVPSCSPENKSFGDDDMMLDYASFTNDTGRSLHPVSSNFSNEFNLSLDYYDIGVNLTQFSNETNSGVSTVHLYLQLILNNKLLLLIIVGCTILVLVILITCVTVIIYRRRYPVRLGLGRKFDTFQNPIYEKNVICMPVQTHMTAPTRSKSDCEDVSDSTVLES